VPGLAAWLLLATACGGNDAEPAPVEPSLPWEQGERVCAPAEGTTGLPHTIEEALALVNALPRPVTVQCLVESLDRPLRVVASDSLNSAQPADGEASPRIFLFSGTLVVSVVPAGDGAPLVEFGQISGTGRTIKGELVFPVEESLPPSAPYGHIMLAPSVTGCALCHRGEEPAFEVDGAWAYESDAMQPEPESLVELETIHAEAEACDPAAEPERCALLRELFEHGAPAAHVFPEGFGSFFQ
jgi:hypothetical protein